MVYSGVPSEACSICRAKRIKVSYEPYTISICGSGNSLNAHRPDADSATLKGQHVGDVSRTIECANTETDWT